MTDDLRTRIARTLYERWWHVSMSITPPPHWDQLSESARAGWLDNADAVIRELGLSEEWRVDMGYGGDEFYDTRADATQRMTEIAEDWGDDPPDRGAFLWVRYVTDWRADE